MPGLVLVTPPAVEPISLTDAKLYCKQDDDTDDDLIAQLLTAARARAELRQGLAYLTQTWDLFLDCFPYQTPVYPQAPYDVFYGAPIWTAPIDLPLYPLQSITYIKYTKADDSVTTLASTAYYLDTASKPGRVLPVVNTAWPQDQLRVANGVQIRFVAGYTAETEVPDVCKNPLRELLIHYYEHRSVTPEIPPGIETELWEGATRQYA